MKTNDPVLVLITIAVLTLEAAVLLLRAALVPLTALVLTLLQWRPAAPAAAATPPPAAPAAASILNILLSPRHNDTFAHVIDENVEKGIWLVKPRVGTIPLELNEWAIVNVRTPPDGNDFYVLTDAALIIVPSTFLHCEDIRSYINRLQSEDDIEEEHADFYVWPGII
jgi:hypothetical protein